MTGLAQLRCLHHPPREAVARCPECARYYCRECITEHEDRVLCADCLKRKVRAGSRPVARGAALAWVAQCAGGLLMAWLFFHVLGQWLLAQPTTFHEGTVWEQVLPEVPL
jgi:hypothetical protein